MLYETAAICLHLADTHPAAALLPALATRERALAYKGLAWCANTLHAAIPFYFYPARDLPNVRPWLDRMLGRPAVQRAFATEKLSPAFV